VQFPAGHTVFDYFYDLKKSKEWAPWTNRVPKFEFNKDKSFFELMVETETTVRHGWCLETLLEGNYSSFFTGESGVGKSVIVQNTFNKLVEKGTYQGIYLNFSAQTDSKRTQGTMMEKLEKISRSTLGAPPGKKNAVFVDDINMPQVETYGAQPPIELLRLFLDRKGLFERTEWQWRYIQDTTLVAAAAPPVGGRSPLTPRFSTHFNMFCVPEATSAVLQKIFGSILGGFLKAGFQEGIQNLCMPAIDSTIEIYEKISAEKRATPVKFHYLFNLRDVSKVCQGILMTRPVSIQSPETFSKLWAHEISRVFCDRLINQEDTDWFIEQVMDNLSKNFKSSLELDDLFGERKIMFADVLKLDAPIRLYEEIKDLNKLKKQLNSSLDEYNFSSSNKMNLVFFEDAILHTLRISRTFRQPRGNIMLIGVGGSGKQSLTRMASYMYDIDFKQIEIVKGYGEKNFKDFIKERMFECGIDGKKVVFAMTDGMILQESFLEDINNILNTGEVPNLMLPEDKDRIQNDVREIVVQMKLEPSSEIIKQVFVQRVRENFHICLAMSPVGDDLRVRCRQFPSLVNCCTLDWFTRWNDEALLFVSREFLKELELPNEQVRAELAEISKVVHTSVESTSTRFYEELRRKVYTTPKSYLDLISLYLNTLALKRAEYNGNKNRLASGLNKLNTTNVQIAELKIKLEEMKPILIKKNEDLKVTLAQVEKDKIVADEKEAVVMGEKEVVEKQAAEAKVLADEAESDVAQA
jgi:dynein heavy chain